MSQAGKNIIEALQNISRQDHAIHSGVVTSVDEDAQTCEVRLTLYDETDGETITVNLNAVSENGNGHIIYPAVDSDVIIGSIDAPGEYALIRASTITKQVVTIGTQVFTMDGNTYSITVADESLYKILNDLISKILLLTVTTSTGPSGTPINATDFSAIQERLNNLLS